MLTGAITHHSAVRRVQSSDGRAATGGGPKPGSETIGLREGPPRHAPEGRRDMLWLAPASAAF